MLTIWQDLMNKLYLFIKALCLSSTQKLCVKIQNSNVTAFNIQ